MRREQFSGFGTGGSSGSVRITNPINIHKSGKRNQGLLLKNIESSIPSSPEKREQIIGLVDQKVADNIKKIIESI